MSDNQVERDPVTNAHDDGDIPALVSSEDLGSASRSCLAIFVVLGIIAVILVIFIIGTVVMN